MVSFVEYCMVLGKQTGVWVLTLVDPLALGLEVLKLIQCFGNPFSGSTKTWEWSVWRSSEVWTPRSTDVLGQGAFSHPDILAL